MNKKNSTAFVVVSGCIQDGRTQHVAGQLYTPATNGYALELLEAGIIQPQAGTLPPALAKLLQPAPEPQQSGIGPQAPDAIGDTDPQDDQDDGEQAGTGSKA